MGYQSQSRDHERYDHAPVVDMTQRAKSCAEFPLTQCPIPSFRLYRIPWVFIRDVVEVPFLITQDLRDGTLIAMRSFDDLLRRCDLGRWSR